MKDEKPTYYVKRVRVSGLFEDKQNLTLDFDENLNCIYGHNGTGKTVFINLLVNCIHANYSFLRDFPFKSVNILIAENTKKKAESFITVTKEHGLLSYTFHKDTVDINTTLPPSYNESRRSIYAKQRFASRFDQLLKGQTYYLRPNGIGQQVELESESRSSFSIENVIHPGILRRSIKTIVNTAYVPLHRLKLIERTNNKFGAGNSNGEVLSQIQEEFSRHYASAQSNIARELESLSTVILKKLFVNNNTYDDVEPQKKMKALIRSQDPKFEMRDVDEIVSRISDLNLALDKEIIHEHFSSMEKIQNDVIVSDAEIKEAQNIFLHNKKTPTQKNLDHYHNAITKQSKAATRYYSYLGMYKSVDEAIGEIEKVYFSKQETLGRFETFKTIINEFLSSEKKFSFDDSGIFSFTFKDRPVDIEQLSSGEQHLIAILGKLCTTAYGASTFIADEPELSLHLDWQRNMLNAIKQLSPKTQVIVATHSPAIITRESNKIDIEECYSYGK
ncbi:AAA family ATPase [Vibrio splendidus]